MDDSPNSAVARLAPLERHLLENLAAAADRVEIAQLARRVAAHVASATAAASKNELLDLPLARRIAAALQQLLESHERLGDARAQALAVGATRFFLQHADAEHDFASALGFDDDARVLNAVVEDIGRPDLMVTF